MHVVPQTILKICKNIGWTSDRKHVRLFNNRSQQTAYVDSKTAYTFNNFTYIREQNVIRVPVNAEQLYSCNYIAFYNAGFGTKWFYAFIKDVKYVNNVTAEISFELDDFQTWWFDVNIGACYVEREHVADDTIGSNIVEEDIGTGELCVHTLYHYYFGDFDEGESSYKLAIQIKPTLMGDLLGGQDVVNYESHEEQIIPTTLSAYFADVGDINTYLKNSSYTGEEVTNCYLYPESFEDSSPTKSVRVDNKGIKRPTSYLYYNASGSYVPKNNKLLCYPYTKLIVRSTDGHSKEFKWENTLNGYVNFSMRFNWANKPSCVLKPDSYQNVGVMSEGHEFDIPLNEFPTVSLSQYEALNMKNIYSGGVNIAKNIASAFVDPIGSIGRIATGVTDMAMGLATDSGTDTVQTCGDNLNLKYRTIGFEFIVMGIKGQNAKVIDSYLTRFGYRVNVIKVPELTSRKSFNFVKTNECEVTGNAPASAIESIQNMFNNGITLWHINDIGNFNADNSIVP